MITLNLHDINQNEFVQAVITLSRKTGLEEKTAYRAGRLMAACKGAVENLRKKEFELIESGYALKNDKGEILREEDGSPMIEPKNKAAFLKAFEALAKSLTVNVKIMPIEYATLSNAGLSPTQLIALEPVISGFPADEDGSFEMGAVK